MSQELQRIKPTDVARNIETAVLYAGIATMVAKLFECAGQSITPETLKSISVVMIKDIPQRFPMLTIEEVEMAWNNGVRGDYGEYWGINVVSLNKWLKAWIDSGSHWDYVREQNKGQKQIAEKNELTPGEINDLLKAGVERCYNYYKKTGEIIDYGNPVWNYLIDSGQLTFEQEYWNLKYEEAKSDILFEIKVQQVTKKRSIRMGEAMGLIGMKKTDIETRAARKILREYFDKLIEAESHEQRGVQELSEDSEAIG